MSYVPFKRDLTDTADRIDRGIADLARERDEARAEGDEARAEWKQRAIDEAGRWSTDLRARVESDLDGPVDPDFYRQAEQVATAANCSGVLTDGRPMAERTATAPAAHIWTPAHKESWGAGDHPAQTKAAEVEASGAFGHVAGEVNGVEQVPVWRLGLEPGEHDAATVVWSDEQRRESGTEDAGGNPAPAHTTGQAHATEAVQDLPTTGPDSSWTQGANDYRTEAEALRAQADVETDQQTQEALYDEAREMDKIAEQVEEETAAAQRQQAQEPTRKDELIDGLPNPLNDDGTHMTNAETQQLVEDAADNPTGYWENRAEEHRQAAADLRDAAAYAQDADEKTSYKLAAIDEEIVAEACDRNSALYDNPDQQERQERSGLSEEEWAASPTNETPDNEKVEYERGDWAEEAEQERNEAAGQDFDEAMAEHEQQVEDEQTDGDPAVTGADVSGDGWGVEQYGPASYPQSGYGGYTEGAGTWAAEDNDARQDYSAEDSAAA